MAWKGETKKLIILEQCVSLNSSNCLVIVLSLWPKHPVLVCCACVCLEIINMISMLSPPSHWLFFYIAPLWGCIHYKYLLWAKIWHIFTHCAFYLWNALPVLCIYILQICLISSETPEPGTWIFTFNFIIIIIIIIYFYVYPFKSN